MLLICSASPGPVCDRIRKKASRVSPARVDIVSADAGCARARLRDGLVRTFDRVEESSRRIGRGALPAEALRLSRSSSLDNWAQLGSRSSGSAGPAELADVFHSGRRRRRCVLNESIAERSAVRLREHAPAVRRFVEQIEVLLPLRPRRPAETRTVGGRFHCEIAQRSCLRARPDRRRVGHASPAFSKMPAFNSPSCSPPPHFAPRRLAARHRPVVGFRGSHRADEVKHRAGLDRLAHAVLHP